MALEAFGKLRKEPLCTQELIDYLDVGILGQIHREGIGGFDTRPFDIDWKIKDRKLIGLTPKPKEDGAVSYTGSGFD
ncbi:MAG: hypothetical protein VX588_12165 [Verrucomicrobiota bacterium]|nr:hypothetical protein [Verrucomicrobiota bacterium]